VSPLKCDIVLTDMGTVFWIGAAIVGSMRSNTKISSPVIVSILAVITPSFWCNLDVLPIDTKEISVVPVGNMPIHHDLIDAVMVICLSA